MNGQHPLPELPVQLQVVPWEDLEVEHHGFEPRSVYVEAAYLPLLGPTTTFLYRRLGTIAGQFPCGTDVDTIDLSVSLGLGESISRSSKLVNSIGRLVAFKAARWEDEALAVRRALPALSDKAAAKLSWSSLELHRRMTRVAV